MLEHPNGLTRSNIPEPTPYTAITVKQNLGILGIQPKPFGRCIVDSAVAPGAVRGLLRSSIVLKHIGVARHTGHCAAFARSPVPNREQGIRAMEEPVHI